MSYESNGTMIIDEIDRLFVVYEKAKDYINKISTGIDEQISLWQYRRDLIVEQLKSSSSSFDFLLPKTQRINELTIDAVQALCRVDLLTEQILRIDPKSLTQTRPPIQPPTSFSARSIDTTISHSTINTILPSNRHPIRSPSLNSTKQSYGESISNGKTFGQQPQQQQQQQQFPVPVLRTTQQQIPATRSSIITSQEKVGFKPIEQQQQSSSLSDNTSRPTPIHPQTSHYPTNERVNLPRSVPPTFGIRTPQSDHLTSPMVAPLTNQILTTLQPPRGKAKVKLQRIPPATKWRKAKIDIIDSLSAFYVENLDDQVHEKFARMLNDLHDYYNNLEQSNVLVPLEDVSIGDFGVAKYSEDQRWYRARLLMCEENNRIRIVYIDFGNIEIKYMDEFYPLDKLYTDLPAQAIACTLSDAFPRTTSEGTSLWPEETIDIFRNEVNGKIVEVSFVSLEEGTEQWPLHFVRITVGNQTVTNLLSLKQRIEPRPNRFIAEHLATSLTHQEYILFNVPISEDEFE